ncbi:MAG: GGDEF domain-containing protein [Magnetococcales bacterium]|nr:GGDEF domain-containing protein [Magnetococcales bacterium]
MFETVLGRSHREHPATRLLISILTNGVKYALSRDVNRQQEVERILKELARGVPEEDLEPRFLDPLRQVARWLREMAEEWARTERFGEGAQRQWTGAGGGGLSGEMVRRLLQGVAVLGGEEAWIRTGTQDMLHRLQTVDDPAFAQELTAFCDQVIQAGEGLHRKWKREREVFVNLVAEVAGYIHEIRGQTGGLDKQLGGAIVRLQEARSVTELFELRETLVREAESLKAHTHLVYRQLSESQRKLRETQDHLTRVSHELAQARVESLTDRLTGIPNRRALDQHMEREVARSLRHDLPLAMLMFDLDHFKKINDTFGHPVGDKVLTAVAGQTRNLLRQSDYLARFGGEEFAVILPETDLDAAVSTANKIRHDVASLRFKIGRQHLQVTASFGVCTLAGCLAEPGQAESEKMLASGEDVQRLVERLLQCADLGLYQAKEGGRNRVEVVMMGAVDPDFGGVAGTSDPGLHPQAE